MKGIAMRKGLALLIMNMLAAEFGYKLEWITPPNTRDTDSFILTNSDQDAREFSGPDKFEEAVQWLREKA